MNLRFPTFALAAALAWLFIQPLHAQSPKAAKGASNAAKADTSESKLPPSAPDRADWAEKASLEELVKTLRADEAWIWDAKPIFVKANSTVKHSADSIKIGMKNLKKLFPDVKLDKPEERARYWDLQPELKESWSFAWDANHFAFGFEREGYTSLQRVFDGAKGTIREEQKADGTSSSTYTLVGSIGEIVDPDLAAELPVGWFTTPAAWWLQGEKPAPLPELWQFEDLGKKERDGEACRVIALHRKSRTVEYWTSLKTGRLALVKYSAQPPKSEEEQQIIAQHALPIGFRVLIEYAIPEEKYPQQYRDIMDRAASADWIKSFNAKGRTKSEGMKGSRAEVLLRGTVMVLREDGLLGDQDKAITDGVDELVKNNPLIEDKMQDTYRVLFKKETNVSLDPIPAMDWALSEWREVASGKAFAFKQTQTMFVVERENAGVTKSTRTFDVTQVRTEGELPTSLMSVEIPEDAQIVDKSHGVTLSYLYKKNRSPADFDVMVRDAKAALAQPPAAK